MADIIKKLENFLGENPCSDPTPKKPSGAIRNTSRGNLKVNTSRIVLESFDNSFSCINPESDSLNFLILDISSLGVNAVVEALKEDQNSMVLIYSEKILTHKKNYDSIREDLFAGYQLLARNNNKGKREKELYESLKSKRESLFSRMFLMSVQKGAGFGFPMINGLLLYFSILIHGKNKASDFEYLMSDPDLGDYEVPIKTLISGEGDVLKGFLYRNFFIERKKIYYVTNNFYMPSHNKKSEKDYELLQILTNISFAELDSAVDQRNIIEKEEDDHRKKVLIDKAVNYRGKTKVLVDAYFDPRKSKSFATAGITPDGYKLCHNIVNYVDYVSPEKAKDDELYRFFDIIPPAMFHLKNLPYEKLFIRGYLEKSPMNVDQSWFGNKLTYLQTEKMLNFMVARKAKIKDVFDELLECYRNSCLSFKGKGSAKNPGPETTVTCFIFMGDKYSGKTFVSKRFTEYLDGVYGQEEVTFLNEYKAKMNKSVNDGKKFIVIDSPMLNKEYNRRNFKNEMAEKIGNWVTIEYIFLQVRVLNTFQSMLIKYTKAAFPTEYSATECPKGYFQCNPKSKNILDVINCFWVDASKETEDFAFEIGRQIH